MSLDQDGRQAARIVADRGADRASNDADVSSIPAIIPYGGFSPIRLGEDWARAGSGSSRHLQARAVHRRGSGDSPLVARGSFTVLGKAT